MIGPLPPTEPTLEKRIQDQRYIEAGPYLKKAAAQALIVITDLCEARGYTTDAITARAELAQAMAIAEGEL